MISDYAASKISLLALMRLGARLPHLATKADLARVEEVPPSVAPESRAYKPSRPWALKAAVAAAFATAIGGGAVSALQSNYMAHHWWQRFGVGRSGNGVGRGGAVAIKFAGRHTLVSSARPLKFR